MTASQGNEEAVVRWYVMRDLKRMNAKEPAYKLLGGYKMEVFVPKVSKLCVRQGKRIRVEVPFIQDLLFVREKRMNLDPIVAKTPTLQYRWLRNTWREPMTVPDADMERFIHAVNASETPAYYLPGELTPDKCGRTVRIVGGSLNGYEGKLLTVRGSKVKRLIVELQGFFSVGVEVNPEYIQVL